MKRTFDSRADRASTAFTPRRLAPAVRLALSFGLGSCLVSACLYDADRRCGDSLEQDPEAEVCVCPEGSVQTPDGCVACGRHEVPSGAVCVCEEGYVENSSGKCEEEPSGGEGGAAGEAGIGGDVPDGVGMSCNSGADCADTEATFCDIFVSRTCQVQGCSQDPDDCYQGTSCCSIAALGVTLCVPPGSCP